MDLSPKRSGKALILHPKGRINHLNAAAFEEAIAPHVAECKSSGSKLLLDLSELEYVSSAGLRVFMLAAKKLLPGGGNMAVAAAPPVVTEILQISRFNLVFPLYGSVADALAAFAAAP